MKPPHGRSAPFAVGAMILIALAALFAVVVILARRRPPPPASHQPVAQVQPVAVPTNPPAQTPMASAVKSSAAVVLTNWPGFQERPFPVAYQSGDFQWTLADGKDTNIIRQLAHNRLEYDRMVEENSRIFRRELVYLKQTAAGMFEQARLTGQAVRQLTLPGLDGQEFQFEIIGSAGNGSSRQGMFRGHLAGEPNSTVTLAFMDGREAFTVLAPEQNIFVVGEPREDGQVIVKAIDPNTYGMGPEDANDAVKTGPPK